MKDTTYKLSLSIQKNSLHALFTSTARVALLEIFMRDPQRSYYQRQLAGTTGLALRAVQRELEKMTEIGLLYRQVEGNRSYYHVDQAFALFPELRSMVMKTASPMEKLHGMAAVQPEIRLCFFSEPEMAALVVLQPDQRLRNFELDNIEVHAMESQEFIDTLRKEPKSLARFLKKGVDVLGRRDDVIWRHIEDAGYSVKKGAGVP